MNEETLADKKIQFPITGVVYPESEVKDFIKKYCEKLKKMEIVSVEVAIYELKKLAGEGLTK